ncbi:glycosyl hydrolase family 2 [Breznakibacter xylanolyticus]|uniref:beta-galactosidase n=1 Tax=Breznakibacter xylanolyticus TaxID=990 RepID=A0A2W7NKN1_9BACT|nr:sugar-binding domain-containing protein [Breznakibacter xylanolyticus]PZX18647.1 glycosyl hydrolase family 2 [Breznakibacter xylanolyticus]
MKLRCRPIYAFLFCLGMMFSAVTLTAQNSLSLDGEWRFRTDREDMGVQQRWFEQSLTDRIQLPGSMPEQNIGDDITLTTKWTGSIYDSSFYFNPKTEKFRQPGNIFIPFWLTPKKHYVNAAWYQRDVTIPAAWNGRRVVFEMERPHWETRVWVDGKEVPGLQNSLSVPHRWELSDYLTPGSHTLTIRIDNRLKEINVGQNSHSVTDHTQGNWNGTVGRLALDSKSSVFIKHALLYPDRQSGKVKAVVVLSQGTQKQPVKVTLKPSAMNFDAKMVYKPQSSAWVTGDTVVMEYAMGADVRLWDEFTPNLYNMTVTVAPKSGGSDVHTETFGFRDIKAMGQQFVVNGRPTVMRGTVENCQFPKTGYPAMEEAEWTRLIKVCRDFGLNHMRFHSYCPPRAAFVAADKAGFYLQVEGPAWANHSTTLGDGKPVDNYLMDEYERIVAEYGNHPSFMMLAYGNEPRGRGSLPWLANFVTYWKNKDQRFLVTSASIGMSAWRVTPESDFIVRSGARGIPWEKGAETMFDYSKGDAANWPHPYVSHEMGQYCVFPNLDEIKKYDGVMSARNYMMFAQILADNHMADQAHDLMMASGKLQTLCYKAEIEASLRTPNAAGFQLLGLNDFSGQGSAIVGMVDSFWDEKGYVTAGEFRRFCNDVVPLARIPKFVYRNDETFDADILVANYSASQMPNQDVLWRVTDENGNFVKEGKFNKHIGYGSGLPLGVARVILAEVKKPSRLRLEVTIGAYANDWSFWVYPVIENMPAPADVYVCDTPDAKMYDVLDKGGKVLLLSGKHTVRGKEVVQYFKPVFWNTSWFKMRPPHTTGILVQHNHPALADFPTDYHSDVQWFDVSHRQRVMDLEDFPPSFRPIVQPIDTWFLSRRLAMLFEANVGKGRLMVCSIDLDSQLNDRLAAKQMRYSILNYMASDKFQPAASLSREVITGLFEEKKVVKVEMGKDAPDEIKFNIGQ